MIPDSPGEIIQKYGSLAAQGDRRCSGRTQSALLPLKVEGYDIQRENDAPQITEEARFRLSPKPAQDYKPADSMFGFCVAILKH